MAGWWLAGMIFACGVCLVVVVVMRCGGGGGGRGDALWWWWLNLPGCARPAVFIVWLSIICALSSYRNWLPAWLCQAL